MVSYGLGLGEETDTVDRRSTTKRPADALLHACQCRDANCHVATCTKLKKAMAHMKGCTNRQQCGICQKLLRLCIEHAKNCLETKCPVPSCGAVRDRLRQRQVATVPTVPQAVPQTVASSTTASTSMAACNTAASTSSSVASPARRSPKPGPSSSTSPWRKQLSPRSVRAFDNVLGVCNLPQPAADPSRRPDMAQVRKQIICSICCKIIVKK